MERMLKKSSTSFNLCKNCIFRCTYITNSPCNRTFFTSGRSLICLAFNTQIHNVVAANSAVVYHNIWKIAFAVIQTYLPYSLFYTPQAHKATAFHCNKEKKKSSDPQKVRLCLRYLFHFKAFLFAFWTAGSGQFNFLFVYVHCWSHLIRFIRIIYFLRRLFLTCTFYAQSSATNDSILRRSVEPKETKKPKNKNSEQNCVFRIHPLF